MANDIEPPVDPLDEQLTAYLDGELPPEEARALEQRLARDVTVRERLRELAGAWDLLDNLPRTTVDESFAKTTVAMVAVAAQEDLAELQTTAPRQKRQQWLGQAAGITAALLLGYASFTWFWPDPNKALLSDLSLVENWQLYQEADSLEFLSKLDRAGLFWSENASTSEPALLVPPTNEERKMYVNQLSEGQRTELRRKQETFDKLASQEQQQLRELDVALQTAPNSARLSRSCAQSTRPGGSAASTNPEAAASSGCGEPKASDRVAAARRGAAGAGARPKGVAPRRKGRTDMARSYVLILF